MGRRKEARSRISVALPIGNPLRLLAAGIIQQAILDKQIEGLGLWCDVAGIDEEYLRRKVKGE